MYSMPKLKASNSGFIVIYVVILSKTFLQHEIYLKNKIFQDTPCYLKLKKVLSAQKKLALNLKECYNLIQYKNYFQNECIVVPKQNKYGGLIPKSNHYLSCISAKNLSFGFRNSQPRSQRKTFEKHLLADVLLL